MLRHKHIDRICCIALAATLLLTCAFMGAAAGGLIEADRSMGYEDRLFSQDRVHTIDIVMNDWEGFLETCANEEYASCSVVIDGEALGNVAIRAKGNTSLSSVRSYGNDRYSFKIEFDHYENGKTYHGLDKLSLNNLIQDATAMKDYLAYTLMNKMGVAAPLCSYAQVNVNGEPWGLYLAVEAVEDSFLTRNYGTDHGELYKPDSMSMGGGRGNGRDFDMSAFEDLFSSESDASSDGTDAQSEGGSRKDMSRGGSQRPDNAQTQQSDPADSASSDGAGSQQTPGMTDPSAMMGGFDFSQMPENFDFSQMPGMMDPSAMMGGFDFSQMPEGFDFSQMPGMTDPSSMMDGFDFSQMPEGESGEGSEKFNFGGFGGFGGMGSSDVMLQYSDDDPSSYRNIFESAKTDVSEADQARLIEALRKLSEGESLEEKLSAVDAEAVIRYLVVHHFMDNGDSYTGAMVHNYYLYEEDGALSLLPWDYNLAFGAFSMGGGFGGMTSGATSSVNAPIDTPVTSGNISARPILSWIFESEEYTERYHEVYQEFVDLCLNGDWLVSEIWRVSEMIAPYIEADENGFFSYEEFTKAIETLKEYAALRVQSIAGQLDGTIPSTQTEQNSNSSALIDASHLDVSDMGGMNMGGGFGGDRGGFSMPGRSSGGNRQQRPGGGESSTAAPDASAEPEATLIPDATSAPALPGGSMTPPGSSSGQFPGGNMTPPDGFSMPDGSSGQFPGGNMTPPDGFSMPDGSSGQFPGGGNMTPPSGASGQFPGGNMTQSSGFNPLGS